MRRRRWRMFFAGHVLDSQLASDWRVGPTGRRGQESQRKI